MARKFVAFFHEIIFSICAFPDYAGVGGFDMG
jgi:hypothetical protein